MSRGCWWSLPEKARERERKRGSPRKTKDGLLTLEGGWGNADAESQFLEEKRLEIGALFPCLSSF